MDVNGTRFHLLQGAADWARCAAQTPATIALGDSAGLRPLLFQFQTAAPPAAGDPADRRRGAARDRYGNWYWIDDDGARLMVRSVGSNARSVFWPIDDSAALAAAAVAPSRGAFGPVDPPAAPPARRFGGLSVTVDHYLLVGTLDHPGLLVFDLHAGGPPRHLRWPSGQPFAPFDMAPRAAGGVFILDRANRCYWALDRQLGVIDPLPGALLSPESFRPLDADPADERPPARTFPPAIALGTASPVAAVDPVAIEALPDGSVLILDRAGPPTVHRYLLGDHLASAMLDLTPVLDPSALATPPALGADLAFVAGNGAGVADRLYLPAASGEQAFAFTVAWQDAPFAVTVDGAAPFLPVRSFAGKGLVQAGGAPYYDFDGQTWLPLIEQRRPRFEREGTFDTPAFDGVEPGCVWHRLLFDGCVSPTAEVMIWSRTADERVDLDRATWSPEPLPRRRPDGRELAFASPHTTSNGASNGRAAADAGTFELLFQRARGRWLQLRIRLRGDGRTTPRLRALRIWYPRFSYLAQYLPAAYRDDAQSASFLDRFLSNLEGLFTSIEDRMAAAQALFDARTAPPEALDWLAGWFGVALDPAWSEDKRRLFLRHAMSFFRTRGTVRGLQTALRLVIDDCVDDDLFAADPSMVAPGSVRIVEWFRLRSLPPLALGDPAPQSGIRQVSVPPPWTPEQGGAALAQLYRQALAAAGVTASLATFPVFEPTDGTAPLWHQFLRDVLSLSATAGRGDAASWTTFLSARYADAATLNDAWKAAVTAVGDVPLPTTLPADGAPLFDWYQFQLGGGRFLSTGQRWIAAQGRAALLDRWTQYQHAAGLVTAVADFPLTAPTDEATATAWQQFAADVLGFVPTDGARPTSAWRDFLARRYRRIGSYNLAYGASATAFSDRPLPTTLPPDGAPLRDWQDFQSLAVSMQSQGHRFTVLLPVPAREAFALELHQQRRDLANRIINLEKPAHTLFDVKFYWAMFRVGEARLAVDTLLDQSSRAPELMPPTVLGQAFLAESHLAATPPERESERPILGTIPLRSRRKPEEMRS
ncbi:MAG TPA: phage tail protein [Polyangia bacterium]|jgi:phage tail-like protein